MHSNDDTLRQGLQAREDVYMALLEAGEWPGVEWHGDQPPEHLDPGALVFHRVPRAQAMQGGHAGALLALWWHRHLPEGAHGNVMLTFDGWADDPRPLCHVPQVVQFCQGLLLGAGSEPNLAWARNVLGFMFDERRLGLLDSDGNLQRPEVFDVPGALWLVAHAHATTVFTRPSDPGLQRDVLLNLALHKVLTSG